MQSEDAQLIPLCSADIAPGDPTTTIWRFCLRNGWAFVPDLTGGEPWVDQRCVAALTKPDRSFKTVQNTVLNGVDRQHDLVRLSDVMRGQAMPHKDRRNNPDHDVHEVQRLETPTCPIMCVWAWHKERGLAFLPGDTLERCFVHREFVARELGKNHLSKKSLNNRAFRGVARHCRNSDLLLYGDLMKSRQTPPDRK